MAVEKVYIQSLLGLFLLKQAQVRLFLKDARSLRLHILMPVQIVVEPTQYQTSPVLILVSAIFMSIVKQSIIKV